jgi:hypothetical protein
MKLIMLRRIANALLLGLSGGTFVNCAAYGEPYIPPHDPTVVLQDFSYTPASPIHVGDTLRLTATLNHSTDAGWLQAVVKHHKLAAVDLRDNGIPPDETDGDGVYSGELTWGPELGDGKGLRVFGELTWLDGFEGQTLEAPLLTILQAEGGEQ